MNNLFSNLLDICVIIYLDDIFIYSNNISAYHYHVKKVLRHLCMSELQIVDYILFSFFYFLFIFISFLFHFYLGFNMMSWSQLSQTCHMMCHAGYKSHDTIITGLQ